MGIAALNPSYESGFREATIFYFAPAFSSIATISL